MENTYIAIDFLFKICYNTINKRIWTRHCQISAWRLNDFNLDGG